VPIEAKSESVIRVPIDQSRGRDTSGTVQYFEGRPL
jgi:hypothetical protein